MYSFTSGIVLFCVLLSHITHAQTTRKVLFLGNSYTYYHNMPQTVQSMADNMGDTLIYDMYAPGGYTLDNHLNDAIGTNKIAADNWDYLILQEQSQLPSFQTWFSNGLSTLPALQRQENPCGRIMFYMTWGRQNGDPGNCASWPPSCTYLGMDSVIRMHYIQKAIDYSTELSPVGAAWRYVRQNHPTINLYDPDGSHPSAAGAYLAACCFYTAIFKKDPTAISYNAGISTTQAGILRQAVKSVVYDSLAFWNHAPTTPTAAFYRYTGPGTNEVQFINTSQHADHYYWDFGDGTSSTLEHPSHVYAGDGTYTVILTSYNCDINGTYQSMAQQTVSLCPFTPAITPESMAVCPATTDTLWTQPYAGYQWYTLDGTIIPNAQAQYLVAGGSNSYYVNATQNGCTEMSAPVSVETHSNMSTWGMAAYGALVGQDTACMGDSLIVSMIFNKPPYPHDSLISWTFNGQLIQGYHNDSLKIGSTGVYRSIVDHPYCTGLDRFMETTYTFINCITNITAVDNKDLPILVYPNPGNGYYTIETGTEAQILVTDRLGRQLLDRRLTAGKNSIDLSDKVPGMYFMKVHTGRRMSVIKIIKQ